MFVTEGKNKPEKKQKRTKYRDKLKREAQAGQDITYFSPTAQALGQHVCADCLCSSTFKL